MIQIKPPTEDAAYHIHAADVVIWILQQIAIISIDYKVDLPYLSEPYFM